jgi:hypothetical protein
MKLPPRDFVLDRCDKTHDIMGVLAGVWTYEKITPADFLIKLNLAKAKVETEAEEEGEAKVARGELQDDLAELRGKLRMGVKLAVKHWDGDAAALAVLRTVKTHSNSKNGTLKQALDWEKAWKKLDSTWAPAAGDTHAAFRLMRLACGGKEEETSEEEVDSSLAGGGTTVLIAELWAICVHWYGEGLVRFPADTAEGILLRDEIPTQVTPKPNAVTSFAVNYVPDSHRVETGAEALHATKYIWFRRALGATEYDWNSGKLTHPQSFADWAAGDYEVAVQGWNSRGTGPLSDPVAVTVE